MPPQTIGVVGAGTMGAGIAQVALESGRKVILADSSNAALETAWQRIDDGLERRVRKGNITSDQKALLLEGLQVEPDIHALAVADFVIEAATEQFEVKRAIFQTLDHVMPPGSVIATNTSSISITRLAAVTGRAGSVAGMHFFNPVPSMALVEVVRGLQTTDTTVSAVMELAREMGKSPIEVKDSPGFLVNRMLIPLINEAVYLHAEGIADPKSIDEALKLGANFPMGPLALADLIGLDVCLAVMQVLHSELGEDKYRPCPLLVRMVDAGLLGRKAGQGFFQYEART